MLLDELKSKFLELNRKERLKLSIFLSELVHPTNEAFDQHWLEHCEHKNQECQKWYK